MEQKFLLLEEGLFLAINFLRSFFVRFLYRYEL